MANGGVVAITSTSLWYATRGAGLACLILFTASLVLGVLNVSRWSKPGWPRFATQDLHRNVSLIALLLLAIHILTAELDTFAPVGWLAVVVPFASPYRPIWLGLGTVASDLFVAVIVTSLVRNRLGHRVWRTVHWAGYAAWPVAVLHGLGTGTDPKLGWVQALTAVCVAAVLVAVGWRLAHARPPVAGLRTGLSAAAVVALIAAGYWTYNGPLKPGWAKRAGTPRTLLAGARSASSSRGGSSSAPGAAGTGSSGTTGTGPPAGALTAAIEGRLTQQGPDQAGQVTVRVDTRLTGATAGSFVVVMQGQSAEGGVSLSSSSVSFGPASTPAEYQGRVVALEGEQVVAVVRSGAGTRLQLSASLNIDPASGSVSGTIQVASYAGEGSSGG